MLTVKIRKDAYFDSVMLMSISTKLRANSGIDDASVAMGTPANLGWMAEGGLLPPGGAPEASPSDLVIAVKGEEVAVARALAELDGLLAGRVAKGAEPGSRGATYRSVAQAASQVEGANIALVSVPGPYARLQAEEALRSGLHVHLFSDNVPLQDEIELKQLAGQLGLLVMGPDCGTAIVAGKGMGFANRVARGDVGIVGASGTGIQQLCCLLDAMGVGISHALGTGSHDLSDQVNGLTFKAAIRALGADPATQVLLLVSKPPSAKVAREVVDQALATGKPVVTCFLGARLDGNYGDGLRQAATLEEAARLAAGLSKGTEPDLPLPADREPLAALERALGAGPRSGNLRGLFCGGSLCTEAQLVIAEHLPGVRSNASFTRELAWAPGEHAQGHLLVDMGDDYYTVGRPHPMMNGSERIRQLEATLADPQTAVVLMDVLLGSGAEADPAGPIAATIRRFAAEGRAAPVVVSFCAASQDPQGFDAQSRALREVGAYLFRSNAAAARAAAALMLGDRTILGLGG